MTTYARTSIRSGNAGTRQSLAAMQRLAAAGSKDPIVIEVAHDIVRGIPERDDESTMSAVLTHVRMMLRYTRDPLDVELVKSPRVMIEEARSSDARKFVGDCDDASVLVSALLGAVGIPSEFAVVAADARRPGEWSHVYVVARARDGSRVPLDPIVREWGVGSEAPSDHLTAPRAYFPAALGGVSMSNRLGYVPRASGLPPQRLRHARRHPYAGLGAVTYDPQMQAYDDGSGTYSENAQVIGARQDAGQGGTTGASTWTGSSGTGPDVIPTIVGVLGKGIDAYVKSRYGAGTVPAAPRTNNPVNPPATGLAKLFTFKNPDGSTNWGNVAIVGLGAAAIGFIVVKAVRSR